MVGIAGGGLVLVEKSGGGLEIRSLGGVDRGRRIDRVTFERAAIDLDGLRIFDQTDRGGELRVLKSTR